MKRVLKNTGSIYVHLDWHASHYVKVEMDKIFGYNNFRREVVWFRDNPSGGKAGGIRSIPSTTITSTITMMPITVGAITAIIALSRLIIKISLLKLFLNRADLLWVMEEVQQQRLILHVILAKVQFKVICFRIKKGLKL